MSDYPMLISNKLHSFRNFRKQKYKKQWINKLVILSYNQTFGFHVQKRLFYYTKRKGSFSHPFGLTGRNWALLSVFQ